MRDPWKEPLWERVLFSRWTLVFIVVGIVGAMVFMALEDGDRRDSAIETLTRVNLKIQRGEALTEAEMREKIAAEAALGRRGTTIVPIPVRGPR